MQTKNELYLVVLSILLGISVLKLTEIFQLGDQITNLLASVKKTGLSLNALGIYLFVAGYVLFFVLLAIASYGIIKQLSNTNNLEQNNDLGPLIGMCVIVLVISYLLVFGLIVHNITLKVEKLPLAD